MKIFFTGVQNCVIGRMRVIQKRSTMRMYCPNLVYSTTEVEGRRGEKKKSQRIERPRSGSSDPWIEVALNSIHSSPAGELELVLVMNNISNRAIR